MPPPRPASRLGTAHARTIQHARIPLVYDEAAGGPAWTDEEVAEALSCSTAAVARVRKRLLQEGLEEAGRPRRAAPGRPPKIDGAAAHLLALTRRTGSVAPSKNS